ncbi:hypothetical protein KKH26_03630 [Patescibacteria group bacterium]|nr:hypothetical protein [Patescibacteria group bacterium]
MKKLMKKKVNVFGKEVSVLLIALVAMSVVSAALLSYFGVITGNAVVSQGLLVDGGGYSPDITEDFPPFTSLEQKTFLSLHNLENQADVDADLEFVRTCKDNANGNCVATEITTAYQKCVSTIAVTTGVRPTVIYDESDSKYKMWYKTTETAGFISYADSDNGIDWTNIGNTDVAGTSDAPFVMKEDGVYYMVNYGTDTTFDIYTSTNGLNWVNGGVIYTKDIGGFAKIDNPKLLKTDTGYNMYFQARTSGSDDYSIFMTTTAEDNLSDIADTATNDFTGNAKILAPGTGTEDWDNFRLFQPMVIKEGNQYIMMYSGYSNADTSMKIGYAVSSNGIAFDKVAVSTEGYDTILGTGSAKPSLVNANGDIVLFYMKGSDIAKATLRTYVLANNQLTVQSGETQGFFIVNKFVKMLVPNTYTISTEVQPYTA